GLELLEQLVGSVERRVVDVLRDLLGALGVLLRRTAHDVDRVAIDVDDPEGDHLILVLDAPGVVDDGACGQAFRRLIAVAAPCLAELVVLARLEASSTEEHEHAFSSPRWSASSLCHACVLGPGPTPLRGASAPRPATAASSATGSRSAGSARG